ncbi:MAG TPA: class I SAM-dependent methyltransferase [Candidatus Paceibacterota bacterium]|nr:class I SAM-dependent methyltransferase [Candidatus Paceibacterota bacterium]
MSENEWDSYAPLKIIDMGGGTGSITELLAGAGHHVTYVDSSLEMAKLAKEKCQKCGNQIDYFTCSVENLDSSSLALVCSRCAPDGTRTGISGFVTVVLYKLSYCLKPRENISGLWCFKGSIKYRPRMNKYWF